MMTRKKTDVESSLVKKGFKKEERDHRYFIYWTLNGQKTKVRTKTSHGSKPKTLGAALLSEMAKQCRLRNEQFLALVDCDIMQREYENLIRFHLLQAPVPPSSNF